jgi:hypothetical protein
MQTTLVAEIRRQFESSPGKKQDPISTNKSDMVAHICNPSSAGGVGGQKCETIYEK